MLQFQGDSLASYDALIALEDKLIALLGNSAKVDGHDFGSGTGNIFIYSSDPELTFWKIRQFLKQEGTLQSVKAAYRLADQNEYTVIWPPDSKEPFTIL